jgi:hypothetical protein
MSEVQPLDIALTHWRTDWPPSCTLPTCQGGSAMMTPNFPSTCADRSSSDCYHSRKEHLLSHVFNIMTTNVKPTRAACGCLRLSEPPCATRAQKCIVHKTCGCGATCCTHFDGMCRAIMQPVWYEMLYTIRMWCFALQCCRTFMSKVRMSHRIHCG